MATMFYGTNNRFFFLWTKYFLPDGKHFHCSCHPLQNFDQDLGEISKSRQDLKILSTFLSRSWWDLRIWAAKNSPRSQNLSSQNLTEILSTISKSRQPKTHQESRRDSVEISKSWRPKHLIEKTGRYFKMSNTDPGKLIINSLSEVVSSRQNKHTLKYDPWLHVKNNQIYWQIRGSVMYSSKKLNSFRHIHLWFIFRYL